MVNGCFDMNASCSLQEGGWHGVIETRISLNIEPTVSRTTKNSRKDRSEGSSTGQLKRCGRLDYQRTQKQESLTSYLCSRLSVQLCWLGLRSVGVGDRRKREEGYGIFLVKL